MQGLSGSGTIGSCWNPAQLTWRGMWDASSKAIAPPEDTPSANRGSWLQPSPFTSSLTTLPTCRSSLANVNWSRPGAQLKCGWTDRETWSMMPMVMCQELSSYLQCYSAQSLGCSGAIDIKTCRVQVASCWIQCCALPSARGGCESCLHAQASKIYRSEPMCNHCTCAAAQMIMITLVQDCEKKLSENACPL